MLLGWTTTLTVTITNTNSSLGTKTIISPLFIDSSDLAQLIRGSHKRVRPEGSPAQFPRVGMEQRAACGQTGLGYDDDTEERKGGLAACEARVLEWLIHIHNAKEGHSVAPLWCPLLLC